ncbi:SnoaL-like polyketide cyclase [filamentous cyanobacterium CCP3]|nr:SnoaL-like polyketide cyclase [filamentous cyanobacterium CCP3]
MTYRSTEQVFRDHLALAQAGDVETDLARNFAPDCVPLTRFGTFMGHAGVRDVAQLVAEQLGPATYDYKTVGWSGELAFLEWTAATDRATIPDGADSFLIQAGQIRAMTIHDSVYPPSTASPQE